MNGQTCEVPTRLIAGLMAQNEAHMNAPRHPAGLLYSVVCEKLLQVNDGDLSVTGIMMNKDNFIVLSPVELPSLLFYLVAFNY